MVMLQRWRKEGVEEGEGGQLEEGSWGGTGQGVTEHGAHVTDTADNKMQVDRGEGCRIGRDGAPGNWI